MTMDSALSMDGGLTLTLAVFLIKSSLKYIEEKEKRKKSIKRKIQVRKNQIIVSVVIKTMKECVLYCMIKFIPHDP